MVAIQIRDVSGETRDALAAAAAARGESLQAYLKDLIEQAARSERMRAWMKRTIENPIARLPEDFDVVELIRRQREERTEDILQAVGLSTKVPT